MVRSIVAVSLLLTIAACKSEPAAPVAKPEAAKPEAAKPAAVQIEPGMLAAFAPLPDAVVTANRELTEDRIELGRMLYFENRLSKNHDVSCNTCHALDAYGVDNKPTSPGHKGALGARNSPTVYNAALHSVQFWDGRAADVEEQATGPIMNPVEMAMPDEARVVATLESMPEYVAAFEKAFPGQKPAITLTNVGIAIGAFERKLVTPSRWDAFLNGDQSALSEAEKEGFVAFASNGCVTCHAGPAVGGQMLQKVGLVKPWPNDKDPGRFEVTANEADRMIFKAPSLRNIAKTGPYFHDGATATLDEAILLMGRHQLGREIPEADRKKIETFLSALTGELPPADFIKAPALPPSTAKTPKADPS